MIYIYRERAYLYMHFASANKLNSILFLTAGY